MDDNGLLKYKACIVIRFVYHGINENIHFPVVIDQKTKKSLNLNLLTCSLHRYIPYSLFQDLHFKAILQRAIPIFKERPKNIDEPLVIIPKHLEVIQVYNATKGFSTYGQPFKQQDYLCQIFKRQDTSKEISSLGIDQYQDQNIRLYLRWPIETVKIQYLGYFYSNVLISDLSSSLKVITNVFYKFIMEKLPIQGNPPYTIVYLPENIPIDQKLRFVKYRQDFKKIDQEAEWGLIIKDRQKLEQRELKIHLQKNDIDVERFLCPVSKQIMFHPYFVSKCRHYFEEPYLRLALEMHRKCPLCKLEATPQDASSDEMLKSSMKCLIQECKVHKRLNELAVMIKVKKEPKKCRKIQSQKVKSECQSEGVGEQDIYTQMDIE